MELLKQESEKLGIILNSKQLEMFKTYMNFLLEYNQHTNLTAIKNPEDIIIKHFLDSILISNFVDLNTASVIDIGTGAGFPGVPLKILCQSISLTLVDSLNKRINFLNQLTKKLDIKAEIFHARAEEFGQKENFREKFDFAVSRAVAPLNILSEYCLPYVKTGGYFVAMKGPSIQEEIDNSTNAIEVLGGKILKHEKLELPLNKGERSLIIVEKVKNTPKNYPRSYSQISKNPL